LLVSLQACQCLLEVVKKGMDAKSKVELIQRLRITEALQVHTALHLVLHTDAH
jgi:hypothetical protein